MTICPVFIELHYGLGILKVEWQTRAPLQTWAKLVLSLELVWNRGLESVLIKLSRPDLVLTQNPRPSQDQTQIDYFRLGLELVLTFLSRPSQDPNEYYIFEHWQHFCMQIIELNPYLWILEKNSKRGTITERLLREKKSGAQHWEDLYMFLWCGFFSQKWRSVIVPKNRG